MLEGHDKLILKTLENENIECEVNYSEDPEVQGCKIFRVSMGDKIFHLKRDDLLGILLAAGDLETQKKLMPVRVTNVKKLERRLHTTFKASKDYRKGEVIEVVFPWIDEVPTEEEIMAGNLHKRFVKKLT